MSKQACEHAHAIGVPWHKITRVYTIADDDPRVLELLEDLKVHCPAPASEHLHIAKARLLSLLHQEETKVKKTTSHTSETTNKINRHHTILQYVKIGLLLLILILLTTHKAHAQYTNVNILSAQGDRTVFDSGNHAFKVNCVTGCSATGSFTDNTAFTVGSTTITNIGAYFTSGAAPSITSGNSGRLRMDASSFLMVNCQAGCSGSSFADSGTFTAGTTNISVDGGLFDDTPPTAITTGKAAAFRITNNRALHVNLRNQAGTEMGTSSNPLQVTLANTGANTNKLLVTADPITFASAQPVTQSGNWTARIVGNAGGIIDAAGQNAASPANEVLTACQFNTSPTTITSGNISPFQCDSGGKLLVNTGTVTVTGTVAATESGTWTVQPGNTANTTAWLVTGTGGTFPVTCNNCTGTLTVQGTLTDNNAAPSTNNLGAMIGIARTDFRGGTAATAGRLVFPDVSTDGALATNLRPAMRPASYRASAQWSPVATTATDILRMPGNASNTVLVTQVVFSCTATTAGVQKVSLIKRSTAGSAGTSANMTVVPMDSNYAAGVSVPVTYTANPTVGTGVGDIDDIWLGMMATGTATPNDIYIGNFRTKPIVLRGTAENLVINLNSVSIAGIACAASVEWQEVTTITP